MAESLRDTIRAALTDEKLAQSFDGCEMCDPACDCQACTIKRRTLREKFLRFIDPALDAWEQTQRENNAVIAKTLDEVWQSECNIAREERDALQGRVTTLEQQVIGHVEGHWFTQGGELQFGELGAPTNADEIVSRILHVVRREQSKIEASRDALRETLRRLLHDANRLCDRQLGGSYEDDCRRSIAEGWKLLTPEEPSR